MKRTFPVSLRWIFLSAVLLLIVPKAVHATTWQLTVGAESPDESLQAMAFLPNEIWISPGDSITWTWHSHEGHTLTLLKPGQVRPSFITGCPGTTVSGSTYDPDAGAGDDAGVADVDGVSCVNSGRYALPTPTLPVTPTSYTVTFQDVGNFKFVCLVHKDMTGVIHVVDGALPHTDPQFYLDEATVQAKQILGDTDNHSPTSQSNSATNDNAQGNGGTNNQVITFGQVVAAGGGRQYLTIMRFLPSTIYVHVGDTVEWTNEDPTEPHTVTFDPAAEFPAAGADPPVPTGASDNDADLDFHGTITSPADLFSAMIMAANQDQTGVAQPPPSPTHIFVTFPNAGTFNYYCALHDDVGMEGKVVVGP